MRRQGIVSLIAIVMAAVLQPKTVAASPIVYNQPATAGPFDGSFGASEFWFNPTPDFAESYDNFTLSVTTAIDGISWRGFYWDSLTLLNNPAAPDTTHWDILFTADDAGAPSGPALSSHTFIVGDVTTTFLGMAFLIGGNVPTYEFHATLGTPFTAVGGTTYWVIPRARSEDQMPLFFWSAGTGGDGITIFNVPGDSRVLPDDRALTLEGVATVPEPGTLTLIGAGLASTRLLRRRRVAPHPR